MLKQTLSFIQGAGSSFMTLLSCPAIGLPSSNSFYNASFMKTGAGGLLAGALLKGLPIYCNKYSEKLDNQIGSQVVISKGAESTASNLACDNVAPLPREWTMDGYIAIGLVMNSVGQLYADVGGGNVIMNRALSALSLPDKISEQVLLMMCKVFLRWIRAQRGPFKFTTREGEVVDAVIKSLNFIDEPEVQNAIHVELTVMEYRALYLYGDNGLETAIVGNAPALSSIFGSATAKVTIVASSFVVLGNMIPTSFVSDVDEWLENGGTLYSASSTSSASPSTENFGRAISQTNADAAVSGKDVESTPKTITFLDKDGNFVTTEAPAVTNVESSVEITDASALSSVCEAMGLSISELLILLNNPLRTTAYLAELPFAEILTTDDEGAQAYLHVCETNIEFADVSVSITARRALYDGAWWLSLSGTVNGEPVQRSSRVLYNTCIWDNGLFTMVLVSASLPSNSEKTFAELSELEQDACLAATSLVFTR